MKHNTAYTNTTNTPLGGRIDASGLSDILQENSFTRPSLQGGFVHDEPTNRMQKPRTFKMELGGEFPKPRNYLDMTEGFFFSVC